MIEDSLVSPFFPPLSFSFQHFYRNLDNFIHLLLYLKAFNYFSALVVMNDVDMTPVKDSFGLNGNKIAHDDGEYSFALLFRYL